jgi:hypothetical protein
MKGVRPNVQQHARPNGKLKMSEVPENIGAGEARRLELSDRIFVFVSGSYEEPSIFVLDVLLDVLLDAFIGFETRGLNVSPLPTGQLAFVLFHCQNSFRVCPVKIGDV